VAGTLRHCGHQLDPRLCAFRLGPLQPTVWDWATFIGTIGMFVTLLFLFVRVLPAISIAEMRELVAETSEMRNNALAALSYLRRNG